MGKSLKLTLPIYFGVRKKTLMSLNWYGNIHYATRNNVKRYFHERIGKAVPKDAKIASPFKTQFNLYYKNKKSDPDNIVAVVSKFLLDALQEHGVIVEDNVQHYIESSFKVIEQDRDNPRMEVIIEEIKCG